MKWICPASLISSVKVRRSSVGFGTDRVVTLSKACVTKERMRSDSWSSRAESAHSKQPSSYLERWRTYSIRK
ncbi:hypothetical protein R1flu_009813 [Riccia fluitans]|uniref:Uncharacterized protein n=1 Tax=Riccia fluitans TaxID=41844 RepID=A0ABD1Z3I3_9MARC